jgi:hypothetical protein
VRAGQSRLRRPEAPTNHVRMLAREKKIDGRPAPAGTGRTVRAGAARPVRARAYQDRRPSRRPGLRAARPRDPRPRRAAGGQGLPTAHWRVQPVVGTPMEGARRLPRPGATALPGRASAAPLRFRYEDLVFGVDETQPRRDPKASWASAAKFFPSRSGRPPTSSCRCPRSARAAGAGRSPSSDRRESRISSASASTPCAPPASSTCAASAASNPRPRARWSPGRPLSGPFRTVVPPVCPADDRRITPPAANLRPADTLQDADG